MARLAGPSPPGRRPALAALLCALACGPGRSQAAPPDPWAACSQAAAVAEQEAGLPPGLLLAVGKVESGRVNPMTGGVVPWPYALNVAGRGLYPGSAQEAAAEVAAAQAQGVLSIDVGCFQVSLLHHPGAFASVADGLDPARNGAYAARFLAGLRARLPTWDLAAGAYHSGTPELAGPYAARVMATWSGAGPAAAGGTVPAAHGLVQRPLQPGVAPPGQAPSLAPGLVQEIVFRPSGARRVRVFAPGAPAGGTWPAGVPGARAGLPAVYGPASK